MDEDQAQSSSGSRLPLTIAVIVALVNAVVLALIFVVPALRDDNDDTSSSETEVRALPADDATSSVDSGDPAASVTSADAAMPTTDDDVAAPTTDATPTSTSSTTTDAPVIVEADDEPEQDPPPNDSVTSTTEDSTPTESIAEVDPQSGNGPSYPTLPDGRPVPIQAIYNGEDVVVAGPVPDEAARERLVALALANSKSPTAEIIDFLTIDPTVPITIGVRVTELESTRFPSASPNITPEHALELDRVVAIMTALPNITVEVLGHADQRGSDEQNYAISSERAQAVADYLVVNGISPLRVSSRPVGEAELLSLERTEDAFALNRRTEFIFYGLLGE